MALVDGFSMDWIVFDNRTRGIAIVSVFSYDMHLKYGVSQGSVLDPRLYCLFSKPIGEICRQHDMDYHCYAADTQEYLVIEPLDKWTYIKSHRSVSG
jgi:hypothetical protein